MKIKVYKRKGRWWISVPTNGGQTVFVMPVFDYQTALDEACFYARSLSCMAVTVTRSYHRDG